MPLITENPWPLVLVLAVVGAVLLALWYSSQRPRYLVALVITVVLAIGGWELERRIVTQRERMERLVHELADAVQRQDVEALVESISVGETLLKIQARAAMLLVDFEDNIRVTDMRVEMFSEDTRATTTFRANTRVTVKVNPSAGRHVATMWKLTWRKENDDWKIVKVERFNPITEKPISPFAMRE